MDAYGQVVPWLQQVFHGNLMGRDLIEWALHMELAQPTSPTEFYFRGSNIYIQLLTFYLAINCQVYTFSLGGIVVKLVKRLRRDIEVQPERRADSSSASSKSDLAADQAALIGLADRVLDIVLETVEDVPAEARAIFQRAVRIASPILRRRMGDNQGHEPGRARADSGGGDGSEGELSSDLVAQIIGGLFFLRVLCPVLLSDKFEELGKPKKRRTVVLLVKVLQLVANNILTNEKEPYMDFVVPFLPKARGKMAQICSNLLTWRDGVKLSWNLPVASSMELTALEHLSRLFKRSYAKIAANVAPEGAAALSRAALALKIGAGVSTYIAGGSSDTEDEESEDSSLREVSARVAKTAGGADAAESGSGGHAGEDNPAAAIAELRAELAAVREDRDRIARRKRMLAARVRALTAELEALRATRSSDSDSGPSSEAPERMRSASVTRELGAEANVHQLLLTPPATARVSAEGGDGSPSSSPPSGGGGGGDVRDSAMSRTQRTSMLAGISRLHRIRPSDSRISHVLHELYSSSGDFEPVGVPQYDLGHESSWMEMSVVAMGVEDGRSGGGGIHGGGHLHPGDGGAPVVLASEQPAPTSPGPSARAAARRGSSAKHGKGPMNANP